MQLRDFDKVIAEAERIRVSAGWTGLDIRPLSADLKALFRAHGISSDPMSTGAAVRTYNIHAFGKAAGGCGLHRRLIFCRAVWPKRRRSLCPLMPTALDDAFSYCLSTLRGLDRDRYFACLLMPEATRRDMSALFLFNAEIARIRDMVREPLRAKFACNGGAISSRGGLRR